MLRFLRKPVDLELCWSVDIVSGHCAYGSSLHVCFDPMPTKSGAIRAVGPYGPCEEGLEDMKLRMLEVVAEIERQTGGYVVWGELKDDPDFAEHSISILGERCGFVPNIAMRSTVLLTKPCSSEMLLREWNCAEGKLTHRSNAISDGAAESPVDLAVLHPDNYEEYCSILAKLCGFLSEKGCLDANPTIGGWSTPSILY